eukprot:668917-Prymnesium_polylepis.1
MPTRRSYKPSEKYWRDHGYLGARGRVAYPPSQAFVGPGGLHAWLGLRPRSRLHPHPLLLHVGARFWGLPFVPARYDMEFGGRLLGPWGFHPCPLRGSRPTQGRLHVPHRVGRGGH